ncbi:hypothetical protein GA0074692_6704 [Micromonospora pallida]|uniref:Uncharacterized protein n=1 Tax=Micromonospora pallida TaxID=145854 RepID=A0A1C6TKX2_9ACTN|nr:hypothetical protein [Micromonospora pallida]SCL42195.1 hypothetical protein GA0074692_6704 [Micromonospora pallida]
MPHLIVQGIRHTIGPGRVRVIEFNTSPLLGRRRAYHGLPGRRRHGGESAIVATERRHRAVVPETKPAWANGIDALNSTN